MKKIYLTTLSLSAILVLSAGCGSLDFGGDEKKVAGESVEAAAASVSNEAVKSVITWGLDGLGNPRMESNTTYEYEGNKIKSIEYNNFAYADVDAKDKLDIQKTTSNTKCDVNETTNEGRIVYEKCTTTTIVPGTTSPKPTIKEYRYTYAQKGYILKQETFDENQTLTNIVTYDYDSFDDNATGFKEVVVKGYSDLGKIVDNAIVATKDKNLYELSYKKILNFSYNEHNDIDISSSTSFNNVGVYYLADPFTTQESQNTMYGSFGDEGSTNMKYYIYNQNRRLDYAPSTMTSVTTNTKLLYKDNLLVGTTNTIENNNNPELNTYTIADDPREYVYEGNRLSKRLFSGDRYTEYKYAGFGNDVYAVKPIEFYLDLTPGMYGSTIYSGM